MITERQQTIKEIEKKRIRLHYILNRDEILKRNKQYNQDHKEEVKLRKMEYDAILSAKQMHGLCHICFCSNIEIFNHKGQFLCDGCLQELLKNDS